ncbi:hypothetical protein Tco_0030310, partial [Tanacetum coccineum]
MYVSTVTSNSMPESTRSSIIPVDVHHPVYAPHPSLVVDSESKPFKDSESLVAFEPEVVKAPASLADADSEEFFEEDPSEDNAADAALETNEPAAQIVPALQISPISSDPVDETPVARAT